MYIIKQSVARAASGTTVEFIGEGGEKISVFSPGANMPTSDALAIDKAKATMVQVATFGSGLDDTEAQPFEPASPHQQEASTSRTYSPID